MGRSRCCKYKESIPSVRGVARVSYEEEGDKSFGFQEVDSESVDDLKEERRRTSCMGRTGRSRGWPFDACSSQRNEFILILMKPVRFDCLSEAAPTVCALQSSHSYTTPGLETNSLYFYYPHQSRLYKSGRSTKLSRRYNYISQRTRTGILCNWSQYMKGFRILYYWKHLLHRWRSIVWSCDVCERNVVHQCYN